MSINRHGRCVFLFSSAFVRRMVSIGCDSMVFSYADRQESNKTDPFLITANYLNILIDLLIIGKEIHRLLAFFMSADQLFVSSN